MPTPYDSTAKVLKALAEPKRLRIIDMLSCGELCACEILKAFSVTQPTLSHDMKLLVDAGLVKSRREGRSTYYSLESETLSSLQAALLRLFSPKPDCICHKAQATRDAECTEAPENPGNVCGCVASGKCGCGNACENPSG